MKEVIINIIKEGWIKNLPVSEVIRNIESSTGLYNKFAQQEFASLVFVSKP